MSTTQAQKEREIDMAWSQHRKPSQNIPTKNQVWEAEERRRTKGR